MNIAARAGLAAAGVAIGGFGTYEIIKAGNRRTDNRNAEIARQTQTATSEWHDWNTAAEREFPGRRLDTPQDHARFEAFLAANPAPAWVSVDHRDFTSIRVSARSPLADDLRRPDEQGDFYTAGVGGAMAVGGTIAAVQGVRGVGGWPGTIAMTFGGGMLAAFGIGSAFMGAERIANGDKPYDASAALVREVNQPR